ncbi:hypothetical protein BDN72DRAFT_843187 [Pluteus cervinus]|uniref:Uncharacterized protein n=1 Tax=Pluteus cervinus TaxID=181527 RepID=A0ACD3APV0_9AGAR|nr:hypothetical protein BDN72DRAFT_843187 [Pluteus cervinus]
MGIKRSKEASGEVPPTLISAIYNQHTLRWVLEENTFAPKELRQGVSAQDFHVQVEAISISQIEASFRIIYEYSGMSKWRSTRSYPSGDGQFQDYLFDFDNSEVNKGGASLSKNSAQDPRRTPGPPRGRAGAEETGGEGEKQAGAQDAEDEGGSESEKQAGADEDNGSPQGDDEAEDGGDMTVELNFTPY